MLCISINILYSFPVKQNMKLYTVVRVHTTYLLSTYYLLLMTCFSFSLCPKMVPYLRADWILDADHGDADEVGDDVCLIFPVWLWPGWQVPVGHADGTQAVACHGLDHVLHHIIPVPWPEGARLSPTPQDGGASERRRGNEKIMKGRCDILQSLITTSESLTSCLSLWLVRRLTQKAVHNIRLCFVFFVGECKEFN